MKDNTINIIKESLEEQKDFPMFKKRSETRGYTYEIEYIPVLVERTETGNIGEIIYPASSLIFNNENIYD